MGNPGTFLKFGGGRGSIEDAAIIRNFTYIKVSSNHQLNFKQVNLGFLEKSTADIFSIDEKNTYPIASCCVCLTSMLSYISGQGPKHPVKQNYEK